MVTSLRHRQEDALVSPRQAASPWCVQVATSDGKWVLRVLRVRNRLVTIAAWRKNVLRASLFVACLRVDRRFAALFWMFHQ